MADIISRIYGLRYEFILLGLTGRTGSGCSTVAQTLSKPFADIAAPVPTSKLEGITNDERKYRIIYNFLKTKYKHNFEIIKASDIIFLYVLLAPFESFIKSFADDKTHDGSENEVQRNLRNLKEEFDALHEEAVKVDKFIEKRLSSRLKYGNIDPSQIDELCKYIEKCKEFIFKKIPQFRLKVEQIVQETYKKQMFREFQQWGNNIRQFNSIEKGEPSDKAPSNLAHKINMIIKMIREKNKVDNKPTFIIIDALRNPYEVLYFRERYSSFYLMSINTQEEIRKGNLYRLGYHDSEIKELDKKETDRKDIEESYCTQDLNSCVELSDIHITHDGTPIERNFDLKKQLLRFIALMMHPGLVPPSPEERIMQVAYTAKLNSGCISRQVGAAVTDENFSLKSIGWNTVPEGQTPCSLRNFDDLYNRNDLVAYSKYEWEDKKFRNMVELVHSEYQKKVQEFNTSGLTLSYCFKDIQTAITGEKNQVHTRSLHAEENAFLQLAKYGSTGIMGGRLFTTASPCVLCAKKAYQLGIKHIYYIDTYPDITNDHILNCGVNIPEVHLFNGAIGRAYTQLYNPFVPLKDEIEYITSIKISKVGQKNKGTIKNIPQKQEGGEKE